GSQKCVETDFKMIADLPTKNEMRAQFVGLLEAPMVQVVNVVNALLTSPLHCMENKCQKEA
ncbi:MAG: 50S ribosomal protein L10, partial [Simkaniaceae bacterium]|nr:50S ribosomal protein L10 [Simkaniaceae bacterium]